MVSWRRGSGYTLETGSVAPRPFSLSADDGASRFTPDISLSPRNTRQHVALSLQSGVQTFFAVHRSGAAKNPRGAGSTLSLEETGWNADAVQLGDL